MLTLNRDKKPTKDSVVYDPAKQRFGKILEILPSGGAQILFEEETENWPDISSLKTQISVFLRSSIVGLSCALNMDFHTPIVPFVKDHLSTNGLSTSVKLYVKEEQLSDTDTIFSLKKICEDDVILVLPGRGDPHEWLRFKADYAGWYNSAHSADGVVFIPQKDIECGGFYVYGPTNDTQHMEMKYRIKLDGQVYLAEGQVYPLCAEIGEKQIPFKFEEPIKVRAGQKLGITVWLATSVAAHSNVETHYGCQGDQYEEVENEHMGLFKLENETDSHNGTSMHSGQIPRIIYFLD